MSRSVADRVLAIALGTMAATAAGAVLLIVVFVAREAWPALREVGAVRFFTDDAWRPTAGEQPRFGILAMLAGSLLVTVGAMALATPLGVLLALFDCFYAPTWAAAPMRRIVELLGGVPSVVFGFWGLVTVAPLINRWQPPGQCLLAGVIVLTLMILPTVAMTATAALRSVPKEYFVSAATLGLGRFATIWNIALPTALRPIVAGLLLAAARAIGETMAVVMVCGNIVQLPDSVFDPIRTVTANIALEMGYATASHRSALFATGLMLMLLIGGAMVFVEFVRRGDDA